jgi:hypothetical protein
MDNKPQERKKELQEMQGISTKVIREIAGMKK